MDEDPELRGPSLECLCPVLGERRIAQSKWDGGAGGGLCLQRGWGNPSSAVDKPCVVRSD